MGNILKISNNVDCRFEGEIENYSCMENVLAKLDMKTIKLSGFCHSDLDHWVPWC